MSRRPRGTGPGRPRWSPVGAAVLLIGAPFGLKGQATWSAIWDDGAVLFDGRARYEFVDEAGRDRNAHAWTARTRFGFETGAFRGVGALVEGTVTRDLGFGDFQSTVRGSADRPTVPDPDAERVNRLQLSWRDSSGRTVVLGRQRLIHQDARFVGNVGFRQTEQTFDALRFRSASPGGLTLDYGYVWRVNRILGNHSPAGRAGADAHLVQGSYALPFGTFSGHAYLMKLEGALAGSSNRTFGSRLAGARDLGNEWRVLYTAEWATQTPTGAAEPGDALQYLRMEGGVAYGELTTAAGIEVLEGDGARGFTTPLATLHVFQGLADLFLQTPPDGLRDRNASVAYRFGRQAGPGGGRVFLRYHHFATERRTRTLGHEWDAGVSLAAASWLAVGVEHASFSGREELPGVRKLWVFLTVSHP